MTFDPQAVAPPPVLDPHTEAIITECEKLRSLIVESGGVSGAGGGGARLVPAGTKQFLVSWLSDVTAVSKVGWACSLEAALCCDRACLLPWCLPSIMRLDMFCALVS